MALGVPAQIPARPSRPLTLADGQTTTARLQEPVDDCGRHGAPCVTRMVDRAGAVEKGSSGEKRKLAKLDLEIAIKIPIIY